MTNDEIESKIAHLYKCVVQTEMLLNGRIDNLKISIGNECRVNLDLNDKIKTLDAKMESFFQRIDAIHDKIRAVSETEDTKFNNFVEYINGFSNSFSSRLQNLENHYHQTPLSAEIKEMTFPDNNREVLVKIKADYKVRGHYWLVGFHLNHGWSCGSDFLGTYRDVPLESVLEWRELPTD